MNDIASQTQGDPQTRPAGEPETLELDGLDAVASDAGTSHGGDPDAVSDPSTDPVQEGGDSGEEDSQAENAGTSLDQPSEAVE